MNSFKNKRMKVVSHDIRSPLTGILGAADFLEESDINNEDIPELAIIIQESAGQIQNLINDMPDSELAEFGKLQYEPKATDIYEVMDELKQTFLFATRNKNISFRYSFENSIPKLTIDKNKFTPSYKYFSKCY